MDQAIGYCYSMKKRYLYGLAIVALALAIMAPAIVKWAWPEDSAAGASDGRPQLVFIYAACTVNSAYLDPYGSELGLTPNLSAFAERAKLFEAHRTEAGLSGIAYAALFTGRHADGHEVFRHPQVLSEDLYDLSEALADNGYEVYYWGGHRMAAPELNYVQGAKGRARINQRLRQDITRFRELIENRPDRPIAVIATETMTHSPYPPYQQRGLEYFSGGSNAFNALSPERVEEMHTLFQQHVFDLMYRFDSFVMDRGLSSQDVNDLIVVVETLYRLSITFQDRVFGGLLSIVDDDALVVFTADHGELLFNPRAKHKWAHSGTLMSEVMTVPLMIAGPGVEPGRVSAVTRSIDVAPTLAGLLDLEVPEDTGWEGVDLSPVLRGEAEPPPLRAFSHTGFDEDGSPGDFAVREGDLVAWCVEGAYSVRHVSDEKTDIYNPDHPVHAELVEALEAYRDRIVGAYRDESTLSIEEREDALRSLGYIE